MATYYCHECVRRYRLHLPVDPSTGSASSYQLDKFVKHVAPTGTYAVNSVFDDKDWQTYKDYMVTTAASGCLEVDDMGRENLIFFAGERTGLRYDHGNPTATCSGVKLVCTADSSRFHAFPSDFEAESRVCSICGQPVPFWPSA